MSYITTVEKNISDSISSCSSSNYILAIEQIEKAINEAVKNNDKNIVAISLALKSLYLYRENKIPFGKIMQELENAHFLADTINNQTAKLIPIVRIANIGNAPGNKDIAIPLIKNPPKKPP